MVSLAWQQLRESAESNLKSLRHSFKPHPLPAAWERDLASLPRENVMQELLFYARVKHYYFMRYEQLQREHQADFSLTPEKARAMRALQLREPVRVMLAGRVVEVTFRGRKALLELGAHDLARREIDRDLDRIAELAAHTERLYEQGRLTRGHMRRRLRHLRLMHRKYFAESLAHTRAVLANALTPDGRAAGPMDAPWTEFGAPADWWEQVTPADEEQLLVALFRAGPERLEALGPPPETGEPKKRAWVEDFGFWSLYAYFEKEAGLAPSAFVDEDVAQFSAWLRAGSPYYPPPGTRGGPSKEVH